MSVLKVWREVDRADQWFGWKGWSSGEVMTGQGRGRAGLRHSGVGTVGMPIYYVVAEYIHLMLFTEI